MSVSKISRVIGMTLGIVDVFTVPFTLMLAAAFLSALLLIS